MVLKTFFLSLLFLSLAYGQGGDIFAQLIFGAIKTTANIIAQALTLATPAPAIVNPQLGGTVGNPGVKLRLTPKGIDYANVVARSILNAEFAKLDIGDIDASIAKGNVQATNIRVTQFDPMATRVTLGSPNRIDWDIYGKNFFVKGIWKGYRKVTFFTIYGSGTFTAIISDVKIALEMQSHKTEQGHPLLSNVTCNIEIGRLAMAIDGGMVGWILNQFRGRIADALRPVLENEICAKVKNLVQIDINSKLHTIPISASIGQGFIMDYGLMQNPKSEARTIVSSHKGEISYLGQGGFTFYPHNLTFANSSESKMLYIYASDYVLNSFLSSTHKNGRIHFTLNEETMPEIAKYLQTTCSDICLGTLFPNIEEDYPNSNSSIYFETNKNDPTTLFSEGKATLNVEGEIQLIIHQQELKDVIILSSNLSLSADLVPHISSNFTKVSAAAKITRLQVLDAESSITDFGQMELQSLATLATPILEELANEQLGKGVVIPLISGVQLKNVELSLLERTMIISTDVVYTG